MLQNDTILALLERTEQRRTERRRFLKTAGTASAGVAGLALLSACGDDNNNNVTPTPTPTPTSTTLSDADILNFALNLEYLEATFYSYAVFGTPLASTMVQGVGSVGTVTGGRQVQFTDPVVAQYAREIALDEAAHVAFLRQALGSAAVALPALNIDGGTNGAFTAAARAAGVVSATGVFDPYASDNNFLLGAYIFEDVGVTAYKGAAPLISSKVYLEAAAGILATEAYHAGLIRTTLYARGVDPTAPQPSLITIAGQISDARDSLDGLPDTDQGLVTASGGANIAPLDANGIAYGRTPGQVLNITYLSKAAVSGGGFFPSGVNGSVKTSAASG